MKNILFLLLILLFSSCTEQGGDRNHNYTIINNSSVEIEIIPYYNGMKNISNKVILNNADKINKTFTDTPPYGPDF